MPKKNKIRKKGIKPGVVQSVVPSKGAEPTQRKTVWWDLFVRPHTIFTILAFVFGTSFMITTPPFQVPDEIAHFDRVFKLTEFATKQKIEKNKSGDYVPSSIDSVFNMFRYLCWQPDNKVEKQQISDALKIPLENEKRVFTQIDAGGYLYFSYLPQLPAVFLGKLLKLNVLYILYLGRFFALLFFIICTRYALKIIPVAKYLLMTIALLPTCLAQAASYNADCVLFSLSFLSLALILKMSLSRESFRINKEMILLTGSLLIMGVLKPVYLPIAFLIFMLPRISFKNNYRYYILTSVTIILSIFLTLGWQKLNTTTSSNLDESIIPSEKIGLLSHNPLVFFKIVGQTLNEFGSMYYKSTIGVLGYVDTMLPSVVYTIFSLLIIILVLFEPDKLYKPSIYQRILLFAVSVAVFSITILAMYLYSRKETGLIAEGVQGRYFIPAIGPFFLSLYGLLPFRVNLLKSKVFAGILFFVLLMTLLITELTLVDRYYS